jgi:translation initiation factor 3 subunit I
MFNKEGDLLFTCSDDSNVVMYHTSDCRRLGVFSIGVACKCIDVSKDSRLLLASSTTDGFHIFEVEGGKLLAKIKVPSLRHSHVEFSFSDKFILVLSEEKGSISTLRIYDTAKCLTAGEKGESIVDAEVTFAGPIDH